MIMIWNRHEVYCGFSLQEFNKVLDVLAAEKIKYSYRIKEYSSMLRYSKMYYVYVHKKNSEFAIGALKRRLI